MPVPGHGEVLVALHAAGVNPVETYKRSGSYANLPPLPWTPGADGGGTVVALGPGAEGTGLAMGQVREIIGRYWFPSLS